MAQGRLSTASLCGCRSTHRCSHPLLRQTGAAAGIGRQPVLFSRGLSREEPQTFASYADVVLRCLIDPATNILHLRVYFCAFTLECCICNGVRKIKKSITLINLWTHMRDSIATPANGAGNYFDNMNLLTPTPDYLRDPPRRRI